MYVELGLFYFFSLSACISGLMVISVVNPIHSVLFLVLVFFNASGLLILLGADFLAMLFLIVYVGAIAVLFLFVVMMLNIRFVELKENLVRYLPMGGIMGIIFLVEVTMVLKGNTTILNTTFDELDPWGLDHISWQTQAYSLSNIEALGQVLYTYYFYYFLVAGIILLVSMIGAIALTMYHKEGVRRQDIPEQLARDCYATVVLKR